MITFLVLSGVLVVSVVTFWTLLVGWTLFLVSDEPVPAWMYVAGFVLSAVVLRGWRLVVSRVISVDVGS